MTKRKYRPVTVAEKRYIEASYMRLTVGQMAEVLKRQRSVVRRTMQEMGLFLPKEEAAVRLRYKMTKKNRESLMQLERYQLYIGGVLTAEALKVSNPIPGWAKKYALQSKDYQIYRVIQSKMNAMIVLLLIITTTANAQRSDGYWKRQAAASITAMSSGFFHRRAEIRKDDFRRYAAVHPKAHPQFANPKLSFRNKYKDWPTDQSAAFLLSKSLLVGATDGFHMDNTISIVSMSASVGFSMSLYEKPNFKQILIQCLVTWASYGAGRWAADKVYKKID